MSLTVAWAGPPRQATLYELACVRIHSARAVALLRPFAIAPERRHAVAPGGDGETWSMSPIGGASRAVEGWVGGVARRVRVIHGERGCDLAVPGAGRFSIRHAGAVDIGVRPDRGADPIAVEHALVGPALWLALAARETFALHASSIALGAQVEAAIAFVGDSGAGKTTLVRGWQTARAAALGDDVLPFSTIGGAPVARPRYPQAGTPAAAPRELPLAAVYVLDRAASPSATLSIERLRGPAAASALLAHLLAARLYGPAERSRAFDAALACARSCRVARLRYPSGVRALGRVRAAIEADAGL